jgi:hypothetical protein
MAQTREFRRSYWQRPIDIVTATQKVSGLVADRCPVIVFGGRLQLHLRGVGEVSVARVHEVRRAAHEAQFHAEQIGAIVQIWMVHALILRLFRLQLRLSEGVISRPCECNDGADSNCDSQQQFQIFPVFRARCTSLVMLAKRFVTNASVRVWNARSRCVTWLKSAFLYSYAEAVLDCRSARPAFPEPE